MFGTVAQSPQSNDWYCSWHDNCLNHGQKCDDKAAFMQWLERWPKRYSHWTEQSPEETWRRVMAFTDEPRPYRDFTEANTERAAIQGEQS